MDLLHAFDCSLFRFSMGYISSQCLEWVLILHRRGGCSGCAQCDLAYDRRINLVSDRRNGSLFVACRMHCIQYILIKWFFASRRQFIRVRTALDKPSLVRRPWISWKPSLTVAFKTCNNYLLLKANFGMRRVPALARLRKFGGLSSEG
jgi:hypothetical protein